MSAYYSTLSGWMIPLFRAMTAQGIEFEQAVQVCQLDHLKQQQDVSEPQCRVAIQELTDLLHYCNNKSPQRDFLLRVTEHFHPCVFHALGYAMLSSSSLFDALQRIVKYNQAVSNSNTLHLEQNSSNIELTMQVQHYQQTKRPVIDTIGIELYFTTVVHIARQILGPEWTPEKVYFEFAKPHTNTSLLGQFFNCPIEYKAANNGMVISQDSAHMPSISGDAEVAHLHDKMFDEFLFRVNKEFIGNIVHYEIRKRLPQGAPTQTELAKVLGLSLRNLQRRLNEQGTCYKTILENIRRKLTMEYLEHPHLSVTEIGYLVGFANVGNFNRAFKRWTGQTPSEYRATSIVYRPNAIEQATI